MLSQVHQFPLQLLLWNRNAFFGRLTMLVQVIAKPYFESMPALEAAQSIGRIISRIYKMVTTMEWNVDNFAVIIHKLLSLTAEIDVIKPLLEDFQRLSSILGKWESLVIGKVFLSLVPSRKFYPVCGGWGKEKIYVLESYKAYYIPIKATLADRKKVVNWSLFFCASSSMCALDGGEKFFWS